MMTSRKGQGLSGASKGLLAIAGVALIVIGLTNSQAIRAQSSSPGNSAPQKFEVASIKLSGPDDTPSDTVPPLFSALQEQLGLKLEAGKGPVKVLVIDHVERPSAN